MAIDPHRRLLLGMVLGLIGLISGLTASAAWRTWLLFVNQVPFGSKDPSSRWISRSSSSPTRSCA